MERNMKSGWKRNIIWSACFVKECWARLSHKNTVGGNGCMSKSIFQQIFLNLEWLWRKGHYCWISNGIFFRFYEGDFRLSLQTWVRTISDGLQAWENLILYCWCSPQFWCLVSKLTQFGSKTFWSNPPQLK